MGATIDALEQFWAGEMPEVTSVAYTPVTSWTPYVDNALPSTGCGAALAQNATYCPTDDSVAYSTDWLSMLDQNYSRTGTMGSVVILAHEFGHHVSDLHTRSFNLGVGKELQADCYAGVFLSGVEGGQLPLVLEQGDVADAVVTLARIADDPAFDWSNQKAHGGPAERSAAMARGWISGDPALCEAYEQTGPILVRELGGYSLRMPPAATVEEFDSGALRVSTSTEPEFTTDVTAEQNLTGSSATDMLVGYAPTYFTGSQVSYLTDVEPFDALPGGLSAANVLYDQVGDGFSAHGVLMLVTRGDGTGVVLDTFYQGPATSTDVQDQEWHALGNFAFSTLYGVS